jgi:hypothetical protein
MSLTNCPTCGSTVRVVSGDEGTSHYQAANVHVPDGYVVVNAIHIMSAFRYALGRQSYIVGDTADMLVANRDALRLDWRQQIIRDIGDAIEDGRAGSSTDVETWTRCAEAMAEPVART